MTVIVIPDRFMLKSNGNDNLCYALYEWKDGGRGTRHGLSQAGWKCTGAYPTTIQRGCELILERFSLSDEETLQLNQAVNRLQDMTQQIKEAISERDVC